MLLLRKLLSLALQLQTPLVTRALVALQTAQSDRTSLVKDNGGADATVVVEAKLTAANTTLAADKALAVAVTGGATAVSNYEASVAALAALKANVAADVDGATASVNTELADPANASVLAALKSIDLAKFAGPAVTGAAVYNVLKDITVSVDEQAKIVDAIKGLPYAASFTALANNDLAINKATAAIGVDNHDGTGTGTIGAVIDLDSVSGVTGTPAADYLQAIGAQKAAATTLANAQAADAKIADAKALSTNLDTLNKAAGDAGAALVKFNTDNATTITTHDLVDETSHLLVAAPASTDTTAAPIKDVFYFGDKSVLSAPGAANDTTISNFGAGDSLVVGNSLSYNSGALSTGDNNKAEFFLVQQGKDTLVVLETANYGSSDVKVDASTGAVTAVSATDHAAIITLTGVATTDLTVNNGVISSHAAAVA